MKSKVLGRSVKLLGMASKLARHELVKEVKEKLSSRVEDVAPQQLKVRIEQAKILAENLSQLKGAAMKAGQLLSLDSSELFPPEVTEILSQLQTSAAPESYELIESVLIKELGREKMLELAPIHTSPLASASIGQVHSAEINNRKVAIKVQYPGIADSIDSDLAILKKVSSAFLGITGKRIDLDEVFEELSIVLHQEADYEREISNLLRFKEHCKNLSSYVVPDAFEEYSTSKVLAMSYEEGQSILEWIASRPSREDREWVGRHVLDLYCREFFDWGLVQTDPNYGNFKIRRSPLKIVLLDFGATLEYSTDFRMKYVELLKAFASLDNQRIISSALSFGLLDPRETDEVKELFVEFLKSSVEPFFPQHQPFSFKNEDYARRAHEIGRSFTKKLKYSAPPRQLIFLHRKLGGIFNLLRKLEVSINLTPYWEKMVGEAFKSS